MIEIKNLSKKYYTKHYNQKIEVQALNNINVSFPDKGLCFVIGKGGSGKTTLFNLLSLLDNFDNGEILIDGINLKKLSSKKKTYYRNNYMGLVFNKFNFLSELNVYQNVKLGTEFTNEKSNVDEILEKVGILELKNRKIGSLFAEQLPRVALARALMKKPKILLYDEPQDSLNDIEILKLLQQIAKECLVIVFTNEFDLIDTCCDNYIELNEGLLVKNNIKVSSYKKNKVSTLTLKKTTKVISLKTALQLSFYWTKSNFKRLSLIMLTFIITLTTMLISFSCIPKRIDNLALQNLYKNDIGYLSVLKNSINGNVFPRNYYELGYSSDKNLIETRMNDNDISYINKTLTNDGDEVYRYFCGENIIQNYFQKVESNLDRISLNSFYTNIIGGSMILNNELINKYNMNLYGNLPLKSDEIVITRYIFEIFKHFGYCSNDTVYEIANFDDIIGKSLDLNYESTYEKITKKFKIVGILDTNLDIEKYQKIWKKYDITINSNHKNVPYELCVMWGKKILTGLHNLLYVNDNFIEEVKENNKKEIYINDGSELLNNNSKIINFLKIDYNNETIHYFDAPTKFCAIFPLDFNEVKNNYEDIIIRKVQDFAKEHYQNVREQFLKENSHLINSYKEEYLAYADYILKNEINKYEPDYSKSFFEDSYSIDNVWNNYRAKYQFYNKIRLKRTVKDGYGNNEEKVIYNTHEATLIGFYDISNKNDTNYPIYLSDSLFDYFYNQNVEKNLYVNYIVPLKYNSYRDIKYYSKYLDFDNTSTTDPNLLLKGNYLSNDNEKVTFIINSEDVYATYDALEKIEDFSQIFFNISIIFGIILIILLYFYNRRLIRTKLESIEMMESLGATKMDIIIIFIMHTLFVWLIAFIFSIIFFLLAKNIVDIWVFKTYGEAIKTFTIDAESIIFIIVINLLLFLLSIIFVLIRLIIRKPMKDILYVS